LLYAPRCQYHASGERRSWAAPHMLTFRGHSRFYSRTSAGKYPLDVSEIRAAFVGSEAARTQLRSFRLERLARITANDGPVERTKGPRTVLHVLPLTAVDPSVQYDVVPLEDPNILRPLYGSGWNGRINFDGALAWSPGGTDDEGRSWSYTQVFRTGAIEGVDAFMLRREYLGKEHLIPSVAFEKALIEALQRNLRVLQKLDAPPLSLR
jgi:hypothetical protein